MPHDRLERTLYSWVASPQVRPAPSRAGSAAAAGETISAVSASCDPARTCSR